MPATYCGGHFLLG